ncbi:MAG: amidohydrolase, partial [Burkholderiaceae bacterium]|nr:amidohydrolase [Burkholderiaceae bacterium]
HTIGKLVKYCGENNVLWGTDSIWYGSPQDQIQAFRAFQIAPALRDKYGYPEVTRQLRAKIFGLNALKIYPVAADVLKQHVRQDKVALQREEYRADADPSFVTYGPKTRREFLNLQSWG